MHEFFLQLCTPTSNPTRRNKNRWAKRNIWYGGKYNSKLYSGMLEKI